MFSRREGPTALRADLVRALSFSQEKVARDVNGDTIIGVAALAAVWNGRKGYVAILVRNLEPVAIERFVSDSAVVDADALDQLVVEGVGFLESLGFTMDPHEFTTLADELREARMLRWNQLRKLRKSAELEEAPPRKAAALDVPPLESAPLPEIPNAFESSHGETLEPPAVLTPPGMPTLLAAAPFGDAVTEASISAADGARAVLGRIALVRRSGTGDRAGKLLARLLAFF